MLGGPWVKIRIRMEDSLYWHEGGKVLFLKYDLRKWRKRTGYDRHSLIEKPYERSFPPSDPQWRYPAMGFPFVDAAETGISGDKPRHEKVRLPDSLGKVFKALTR